MAWIVLIVAGLFEVAWASLLDRTDGLTEPVPTAGFLVTLGASMYLLAVATQTIPVGTAYAVWVGVGVVGTFIVGVVVKNDATNLWQAVSMVALIASIVAVKLTAPS